MKKLSCLIFALVPIFLTTCISFPPLASTTSGDQTVNLVVNVSKKRPDNFLGLQKAVLGPGKANLLLVTSIGSNLLFDNAMDFLSTDKKKAERMAETVVGSGRAGETMKLGDTVFIIVNEKKVDLQVTFPMATVAKCRLKAAGAAYRNIIAANIPVFK